MSGKTLLGTALVMLGIAGRLKVLARPKPKYR